MTTLNSWFKQQERRNQRFVSLYDFLFLNHKKAYIFFRLNFFCLQKAFRYLIHLAIFFILYTKLHDQHLTVLIIFFGVTSLVSAAWWGILEILRTKVRYAYKAGKTEEIGSTIGNWLLFSVVIAAGFLVVAIIFSYQILAATSNNTFHTAFVPLYIIAICIINAGEIVIQTFRAGVYAVTRIVRPAVSLIIGPLIAVVILFCLLPITHYYTLLIAFISEHIINMFLIFIYTKRMFYIVNFSPTLRLRLLYDEIKNFPIRDAFLSGTASAFMHLDGWLILAAYLTIYYHNLPYIYLFAIFLIAPLIRAGFSWAQLFYFDIKRLEHINFKILTQHFDTQIDNITLIIGLIFWLITSLIMLLAGISFWKFYILLLPLFCLRSQIAYRQIRAFSTFHYLDVIYSGCLLLLSYVIFLILPLTLIVKLNLLLLIMIGIDFGIKRFHFPAHNQTPSYSKLMHLYEWLSNLKNTKKKSQIFHLHVSGNFTYYNIFRFLEKLRTRYQQTNINTCHLTATELLLCCSNNNGTVLLHTDIASCSLGLVKKIQPITLAENNLSQITELLNKLTKNSVMPMEISLNNTTLRKAFMDKFPDGFYFDPTLHYQKNSPAALNQQITRNLLYYVRCYLDNDNKKLAKLNYYVAVLFNNSIEIIFLIPKKKYPKQLVMNWLKELRQLNIQNCLSDKI